VERISKESVLSYMKCYPKNLRAGTEENHDEPQSGISSVLAEIRTQNLFNTSARASALTPTSSGRVLGEKLVVTQLVRKFHIFYARGKKKEFFYISRE
jgi:hypothetical protein